MGNGEMNGFRLRTSQLTTLIRKKYDKLSQLLKEASDVPPRHSRPL